MTFFKYQLSVFLVFIQVSLLFSTPRVLVDSLTVPIFTYFNKGESQKYVIKQGKMKYKGEIPTDSSESKRTITLTAVDSTTEGYVMEIFDENFENSASGLKVLDKIMEDSKMRTLAFQYANFKLRFKITPDGSFKGFENMDSLIQLTHSVAEFLKKESEKDKKNQRIAEELSKKLLSREVITDKLGLPYQLMFGVHGFEYMADTAMYYDDELPNNFEPDGKPIPTSVGVHFSYLNTDSAYINVERITELDEDITTKLIVNFLKKISPKKEHKELEKLRMSISDRLDMEIHQPTGWVTYLLNKRTSTTTEKDDDKEESATVDYIEIEIIPKSSEEQKKE